MKQVFAFFGMSFLLLSCSTPAMKAYAPQAPTTPRAIASASSGEDKVEDLRPAEAAQLADALVNVKVQSCLKELYALQSKENYSLASEGGTWNREHTLSIRYWLTTKSGIKDSAFLNINYEVAAATKDQPSSLVIKNCTVARD